MSNVDINVDRRTDGQKIGRLYRTLLQAGVIKSSKDKNTDLSVVEKYFSQIQTLIYTEGADLTSDHKIVMFSTLRLLFIVTMSTACVRRAARLGRALAGIYQARPDWLLAMACPRVTSPLTGTRS